MALGRSPEYHWNQIISKSLHWFSRRSPLKLFLFIALAAILSTERHSLCNFGGQSPKEHSCIIISKSMHWLRRRSHLKVFLFLALVAILFNGADWFEKKLLDSHLRNIPVKLFQKLSTDLAEEVIKS